MVVCNVFTLIREESLEETGNTWTEVQSWQVGGNLAVATVAKVLKDTEGVEGIESVWKVWKVWKVSKLW